MPIKSFNFQLDSWPLGDVMGPGFFTDYPTAEDTVRKPWASAEQNMYNFAYTMLNLLYQRASQQLNTTRLRKSLTYLNTGIKADQLSHFFHSNY